MTYRLYQLLARLPLGVLYSLASMMALVIERLVGYRKGVIDSNLLQAFPEKSPAERKQLRHDFYTNLADTTLEVIKGSELPLDAFRERLTIVNPELLTDLSDNFQQSVIVLTLHMGNWEWMLHRAAAEYPVSSAFVYKTLHSPDANRFSLETRTRFGAHAIEMRDAARDVIKNRRTPRLIFMVADQSPGFRERVHWTTFLNQNTAFFSGGAALARATGFPLAFTYSRRAARGRYQIELAEIARDPKNVEEEVLIERYARLTENAIKASPADWLWSNRRWKLQQADVIKTDR